MPIHYATVVMRGENISLALAAPAAPIAARLRRYGRVTFWNFVYNSAETNIVIRKLYNYSSTMLAATSLAATLAITYLI